MATWFTNEQTKHIELLECIPSCFDCFTGNLCNDGPFMHIACQYNTQSTQFYTMQSFRGVIEYVTFAQLFVDKLSQ